MKTLKVMTMMMAWMVFFPGSDDELGFLEEIEADEEYVSLYVSRILTCIIKFFL